jgi:hypothetical protein
MRCINYTIIAIRGARANALPHYGSGPAYELQGLHLSGWHLLRSHFEIQPINPHINERVPGSRMSDTAAIFLFSSQTESHDHHDQKVNYRLS